MKTNARPANLKKSATNGFTLIELLIVIAIVAILAAILFPVFARVRENARRSSCQSNLKQIGLGIMQYSQDFDETMPRHMYYTGIDPYTDRDDISTAAGVGEDNYKWMDAIDPYVKSRQIFVCPSAGKIVGSTSTNYSPNAYFFRTQRYWGSYGINNAYMTLSGGSLLRGPAGQKLSRMPKTAETVLVTDTNGNYVTGPFGKSDITPVAMLQRDDLDPKILRPNELTDSFAVAAATVARHLDFTNVLYCDGHVKAQKLQDLNVTRSGTPFPFKTGPILVNFTVEDD